ncbi:Hint domain-containing protein [uncultured Sulfitobacter sp.]|uniref:Hint domain-containing protein n=1 Tax=uncultured Sulfitobacter sp. TaxID=191468 RepID=UPI002638DD05|nr:Hint domain-containing protein [uncultured Sulfitobacter sp.]
MIDTPDGPRAVEILRAGDLVLTVDHGPQNVRWVRSSEHALEDAEIDDKPVLIQAAALGVGRPAQDLIVSPQHRILVGGGGQLIEYFKTEAFVPAKALTGLPGIRHMKGKAKITWIHFACQRHEVVTANGCLSESLLLGPAVLNGLNREEWRTVVTAFEAILHPSQNMCRDPARTILKVGEVRRLLATQALANSKGEKEIRKWNFDAAMEKFEADHMHFLEPSRAHNR